MHLRPMVYGTMKNATGLIFILLLMLVTACGNGEQGKAAEGAVAVNSNTIDSSIPAMIGSRPGEAEMYMNKMLEKAAIPNPQLKEVLITFMNDGQYKQPQPHSFYVRYRSEQQPDKEQEMHYDFEGDSVDKHTELNASNYTTGDDPYVFQNNHIDWSLLPEIIRDALDRGAATVGNACFAHSLTIAVGGNDDKMRPQIEVDVRNSKADETGLRCSYDAATGAFLQAQNQ